MANINLLPWREEAREKQKRDYLGILAAVFIGAALVVYLALTVLDMMTEEQRGRNAYLQGEIQLLEKQIAEIKKIRERKKDIERRTEIILNLQQARNLPTHVLDELVRVVPPGIYLSSIEKKGSLLWIQGRSESNNNVANMMRKIKASMWLHDPNMQSIVSQNDEMRQLQRFSLRVSIGEEDADNAKATQGASK
ncbi:PilN domain-containing protein [Shewanella loihica]|uniref:Fimbrial assembly family protein n=1 Tax=Shewanella loihica (strain ATCC BAA-1088 / PV-4) TaxID=323850 RepID=A3Q9D3_SHELP|nr:MULTISPECIES: PilN domain-containing protein [Shewanella]ABO22081.1 Fimbrial assembly family protein [Shewanella loihica PV-4]QYJ82660.1 PilN domain-containing protein [Shewanella aegiceratis]QYJ90238.1 PilN domain-containing protein [Shewanella halotolerans]QYJ94029.1 PilN domain-containing protein [Shewanella spartinae]QYJ97883.1 PilN domain-containing protein [Shewanella alkalitolerans]